MEVFSSVIITILESREMRWVVLVVSMRKNGDRG
jgi:hypothetical protein